MDRYDALGESQRAVRDFCEQARQSLGKLFPSRGGGGALEDLTYFLEQQTNDLGVVH
jgi:hypothetical protein